jgi:hypothetical protein
MQPLWRDLPRCLLQLGRMTMTAEQERAQIVKYLRETAAIFQGYVDEGDKPLLHRHHADSCTYAANAIEAGDHWIALDK